MIHEELESIKPPVQESTHRLAGSLAISAESFNTQEAPTGLVLQEAESNPESAHDVLKSDIESLKKTQHELNNMYDVAYYLDDMIIGSGLQTIAERYGADKVVSAIKDEGPNAYAMTHVISSIEPDKRQRKKLYLDIESEPIKPLCDRLNEVNGGASGSLRGHSTDGMATFRKFEMLNIRSSKGTETSYRFMPHHFSDILEAHPKLLEDFRDSNDTVALLSDIRDVYKTGYESFMADFTDCKTRIESMVGEGEVSVEELRTLSDEIYTEQIASLEEKLANTKDESARTMIQSMLDSCENDALKSRDEFEQKLQAVRGNVLDSLDAKYFDSLEPSEPTQAEKIHHSDNH